MSRDIAHARRRLIGTGQANYTRFGDEYLENDWTTKSLAYGESNGHEIKLRHETLNGHGRDPDIFGLSPLNVELENGWRYRLSYNAAPVGNCTSESDIEWSRA